MMQFKVAIVTFTDGAEEEIPGLNLYLDADGRVVRAERLIDGAATVIPAPAIRMVRGKLA